MPLTRRSFIKRLASIASVVVLLPSNLLAAWPKAAFSATEQPAILAELYGEQAIEPSKRIQLKLDKRVESGDSVPVEVATSLDGVESITLLLSHNPHPLAANIRFDQQAVPFLATRLRLNDSCQVTAIVKTADGLYSRTKSIKVLVGGCHP